MTKLLNISDAAAIAIHTMVILAGNPKRIFSTKELAQMINGSEAHLSKVLQRLAKVGLVKSVRGPKGGFIMGREGQEVTLYDVYQAIDGPLRPCSCLFRTPVCEMTACILGNLIENVNTQFSDYLSSTKLSDLVIRFRTAAVGTQGQPGEEKIATDASEKSSGMIIV